MGMGAAAVAVWSAVLAVAAPAPGARSISLRASFVLKTIDAQGTDVVSGAVNFVPGGEVCVAVKSPNVQEMHLTPRELTIYYPDRDLAFVAHFEPPQPPPMLDALAAGIVDPASTLPPDSKLIERKRDKGNLVTRWRAVDAAGKAIGEMRAVESRAGALSLELLDPSGKPQRRFTFGDRVTVGAHSVPRSIVADYFAAGGVQKREEQWSLADVAPLDPRRPLTIGCARLRPQTKIQALSW
ncbi:MAG TPA: hypothetical protein VGP64_05090 [Polyangia bacterium]